MTHKKIILLLVAAAVFGGVAGNLILPFLVENNLLGSANLLSKFYKQEVIITKIEEKQVPVPQADYFSEAINKISSQVVAVESFSQGQKTRSGGGVIMTQDGLVVTLNSLVPAGNIYQVSLNGEIENAKVVSRDYASNLAFLNIGKSGFQVASLKTDPPVLAQNLLVFSRVVNFGKDQPLVQEAAISQTNQDPDKTTIYTPYNQSLFGAAVLDSSGSLVGLNDFKGQKAVLISASRIQKSLNSYLTKAANL